jgi:hypothetical protein
MRTAQTPRSLLATRMDEGALRDREVNHGVCTTVAEAGWRRPENFVCTLVKTTVGVESGIIDCVRYRLTLAKCLADALRSVSSAVSEKARVALTKAISGHFLRRRLDGRCADTSSSLRDVSSSSS